MLYYSPVKVFANVIKSDDFMVIYENNMRLNLLVIAFESDNTFIGKNFFG